MTPNARSVPLLRCGLLAVVLVLSSSASAQIVRKTGKAEGQSALLAERGQNGQVTIVTAKDEGFEVARRVGEVVEWSRELPGKPNFLAAGTPFGTVVVGYLRNDGSPRWASVITATGEAWQPPGEVRSIHLSPQGDKVLTQVKIGGGEQTFVFDSWGHELARFEIPQGAAHVVRFTALGDAVAVTPGPEDMGSTIEVFEIGTGRVQKVALDPSLPIEDAVALDHDHVVVVGGGTLTMVLLPGAVEYADEGVLGWSLQAEAPGYLTLLGWTADGEWLLATRGFGQFDVISREGAILWSFDPRDPAIRQRLSRIDLDRVQPFLRSDGVVELGDDSGRGHYVLTWPEVTSGALGSPKIMWQAETPLDSW